MGTIVPSGDALQQEREANHEAAAMEWREQARLMREVALLLYGALKAITHAASGATRVDGALEVCERAESVLFPAEPESDADTDQQVTIDKRVRAIS